eukprot:c6018_g1_i1 orf=228-635(+)
MDYHEQRCLGLFLMELHRRREWLLQAQVLQSSFVMSRITSFFKPQTQAATSTLTDLEPRPLALATSSTESLGGLSSLETMTCKPPITTATSDPNRRDPSLTSGSCTPLDLADMEALLGRHLMLYILHLAIDLGCK